ncbi:MAG: purine-binding chemotaxis protein CheW [Burkholderiales bacterium]|nr:purine-binding chemotaxis protein CheW [Burkholderiales bacterium]
MNGPTVSPAEPDAWRILRARARALARPAQHTDAGTSTLELLEFRLARESYAVETRHVREVYPLRSLTPLPCTPPFMPGIVNVRGRIAAVIDIKKFFDLPDQGLTDLHRVILVRCGDLELGLLADTIEGVRVVAQDSLASSLSTFSGVRADYLKGVTAQRLVVLDLDRIMADPKIVVDEEVEG